MNSSELERTATKFFDDFVEAFRSFDGSTIARRYLTPYLAFHAHGSTDLFGSHAEIAEYFQRIVDAYYADGCRSCRYADMQVFPLGQECAIGTVTWQLLSETSSVLTAWRESYNLFLVAGEFQVFTSTDHVT